MTDISVWEIVIFLFKVLAAGFVVVVILAVVAGVFGAYPRSSSAVVAAVLSFALPHFAGDTGSIIVFLFWAIVLAIGVFTLLYLLYRKIVSVWGLAERMRAERIARERSEELERLDNENTHDDDLRAEIREKSKQGILLDAEEIAVLYLFSRSEAMEILKRNKKVLRATDSPTTHL